MKKATKTVITYKEIDILMNCVQEALLDADDLAGHLYVIALHNNDNTTLDWLDSKYDEFSKISDTATKVVYQMRKDLFNHEAKLEP